MDPREVGTSFRAIEAGALAIVARPQGLGHPEFESDARELIKTVKLMSEVKVVRRWTKARLAPLTAPVRQIDIKRDLEKFKSLRSAPLPEAPSFCRRFYPRCQKIFSRQF